MHMEDQGGGDGAPVAIPPQEGEEEVNSFPIAKLLRPNCSLLNYFLLLPSSLGEIRSPGSGTDSSTSRNDDSGLCYIVVMGIFPELISQPGYEGYALASRQRGARSVIFPLLHVCHFEWIFFSILISPWIQSWSWHLVMNLLSLQRYQACWYSAQRIWRISRLWSRDQVK